MPKSTTTPKAQAEAEKRKLDTLVRAVEAAKDGKDYTRKDDKFYLMVDELKAYKKEFGDCNVPSRYQTDGLGSWVAHIREQYKKKDLSDVKIKLLESIGFVWRLRESKWSDMYAALKAFKEEHGHTNVSKQKEKNTQYKDLGSFVSTQRRFYKEKRMRPDRIKLMEDIGFCWNIKDEKWGDRYQLLKAYFTEHGNLNLDSHHPAYIWMGNQRDKYHHKKLSPRQIALLNELGMDWGIGKEERAEEKEEQWQKMYKVLKAFKEETGHCNVPDGYKLNPDLDLFVQQQRKTLHNGTLKDDKKKLLEDIGFMFTPRDDKWTAMYQRLLEYKEKFGDCDVSKNYAPHGLGTWVKYNRKAFKNNKLAEDRIQRLNDAGFSWTMEGKIKRGRRGKDNPNPGPGRSWEEWIQKLTSYREEHGDCRVPKAWAPDPSLANWVRNKRMHRKKGILSEEEIAQLDDLGFDWAPGAGNYKRKKGAADTPMDDELETDFGLAPFHHFEEGEAAPGEPTGDTQQHGMAYQVALNQSMAENERLSEINRQQADEIARLRAQLSMPGSRVWL